MPEGTEPTLQHGPLYVQQLQAQFSMPLARCTVSAAAESANKRRLTLQVIDRLNRPAKGIWEVLVYLSATSGAAPSATGNTVAVVAGTTQLQEITANAAYALLTDANGQAQIDLTIAGAATRYVSTLVRGKVRESEAITWAA